MEFEENMQAKCFEYYITYDASLIVLVRKREIQIEFSIVNTVHILSYTENRKKLER